MAVSLRRTLAARYSLTMAGALLGITLWAYLGVRRTLRDQLDSSLRSSFELQSFVLVDHGTIAASPQPADAAGFVRQVNRLVVVRDSSGRIVQANSGLAGSMGLDTASFRRARAGGRSIHTVPWLGTSARALAGPTPPGSPAGAAVLEIAASLGPLEAASRAVLHRMLATALVGALATLVGAWWLAGVALAPVREIAAEANLVQGTRPGQRITVHAHVEELQGLIQVLNAMLDRLERAYQWHRRMLRDLGHDLRTPITAMRAGIEVALLGQRTTDDYRRVLASTLEEVDRLALIGDGLSLLGRLESGGLTIERHPTDVRAVAVQAVARARERVGGHPVDFEHPPHPVDAAVDRHLLGLALDQLLDNAVRHTPPGTRVELALQVSSDGVVVIVEDEGPGVPDEVLPHLFERFYRADAARGRDGGPGLGLTVVAAIAELHHGRVTAQRGRRGGLQVRLDLPQAASRVVHSPAHGPQLPDEGFLAVPSSGVHRPASNFDGKRRHG